MSASQGIESQETTEKLKAIQRVLIQTSDLNKLSNDQREEYYLSVCSSLGLNPMTRPLEYTVLNGKMVLYARKDATDQLRRLYGVSVTIQKEKMEDLFLVTAHATMPNGRVDESIGAVNLGKKTGDDLANAIMKSETKSKRRVTLSICGLGLLDETEVQDATSDDERPSRSIFGVVPRKASEGGQGGGAGREIAAPPNPEQPKSKQSDFQNGHNLTSPYVAVPFGTVVIELSPG